MIDRPQYRPGHARVGEPTPQDSPELFTDAEIQAEIDYLTRLDRRYGAHVLREVARVDLRAVLAARRLETSTQPADVSGLESCQLCGEAADDETGIFWDGKENITAHGQCGTDAGLSLA